MKHLNIIVKGRVQGVGFRNSAKHQARFLGVKGYVKNTMDGNVFIEAEGNDNALAEFVKWCRKGPSFAMVDEIEVTEGSVKPYSGFEARY